MLYFTKVHKDTESVNKLHPIDELQFKVNGRTLLAEANYQYYNSVVPVEKFTRSSDYGDYMYSFSLYPCISQPSGQLNSTNLGIKSIMNPPKKNVGKDENGTGPKKFETFTRYFKDEYPRL